MLKQILQISVLICFLTLFVHCTKNENEKELLKFKVLSCKKSDVPVNLKYNGQIVHCLRWEDSNGDNFLLLTEEDRKTKEVSDGGYFEIFKSLTWHGYHYCNNGTNQYGIVREFVDFIKDCEFDLELEFMQDYIKITDLDNDNFGEITVIYKMTCTSDVSPWIIKLLMFENGEKFSIKGNTKVEYGPGEYMGGEKKIDASLKNTPNVFLEHAEAMFDRAADIK